MANTYGFPAASEPREWAACTDMRVQFGVYHHVTGVDASSSASLAAYINTLTYKDHGQAATAKIVQGVYWSVYPSTWRDRPLCVCLVQAVY